MLEIILLSINVYGAFQHNSCSCVHALVRLLVVRMEMEIANWGFFKAAA